MNSITGALICILGFGVLGCQSQKPAARPLVELVLPAIGDEPRQFAGLHNVIRVSDKLLSGSSPDDVAGFESLRKLGIRTIISVDGSRPDVDRARERNLRYVHLPVGYDGISQEQANRLARAVRDLPAPIYLHCHHGKHRGPAAAAAVQLCLDRACTPAAAVEIMKRAGTDPHYTGLFGAPHRLRRPTREELAAVGSDFPETSAVPALVQAMVEIDATWDHLSGIRKAGWKPPKDKPDLDPPHEAKQLGEHYRELARLNESTSRPADYRQRLLEAEQSAAALESNLRSNAATEAIERTFQRCRTSCAQCHAQFRDVPRKQGSLP